jgi:integrase
MRKRRTEVSYNTIANDLYGLADLFDWGDAHFSEGELERFLSSGGQLNPSALDSLVVFVRERKYSRGSEMKYRSVQTAATRIASIEQFLTWVSDPFGRGGKTDNPVSPEELQTYRSRLRATFKSLRKAQGQSTRPDPLTHEQDELLEDILSPSGLREGVISFDKFPTENPFQQATRLRTWILYSLLRHHGLRRGEALKLKVQDVDTVGDPEIRIRRRPHDPDDSRTPAPRVKGMESVVPLSRDIANGIRAYLTDHRLPGHRRKGTNYLLTTRRGTPLSTSYTTRIFRILRDRHSILEGVTPHALRHTWAEELANHLFKERDGDSEEVVSLLREAGRWKPGSDMPYHYVQNAIQSEANRGIRKRTSRLYSSTKQISKK